MADQFDLTQKAWVARPAVVIASGPSLTAEDCELVRQARAADLVRVVSVSNAWKYTAAWADQFYAADRRYWKAYMAAMVKAGCTKDRMVTRCNVTAAAEKIRRIRAHNKTGIGTYELHTGGNSGFMGLNLAFVYGARRILLLGFDMQDGPKGQKHFDGAHPLPLVQAMPFKDWINKFTLAAPDLAKRGATVINCSRVSALTCFLKRDLASELPKIQEPA